MPDEGVISRNGLIYKGSSGGLLNVGYDHYGHGPDAPHWGHVGELGWVEAGLDELLAIFRGDGD